MFNLFHLYLHKLPSTWKRNCLITITWLFLRMFLLIPNQLPASLPWCLSSWQEGYPWGRQTSCDTFGQAESRMLHAVVESNSLFSFPWDHQVLLPALVQGKIWKEAAPGLRALWVPSEHTNFSPSGSSGFHHCLWRLSQLSAAGLGLGACSLYSYPAPHAEKSLLVCLNPLLFAVLKFFIIFKQGICIFILPWALWIMSLSLLRERSPGPVDSF